MKKLVEETEEGLVALLGERIVLMCTNYFYAGKLVGVNETCVKLESAKIVYSTGSWSESGWDDAQELPSDWYVALPAVESFGVPK